MPIRTTKLQAIAALLTITVAALPSVAQTTDSRAATSAERGVQFFRPDDFAISNQPTDHDIVLMEPHQPWYVTAHGGIETSDNAFLTEPKRSDVWAVGVLDGGFETTIDESFDLQVGGQVSSSRFNRYSELDTDALAGIISVSKRFDSLRVGVEYIPSVYFGRGFNEQSLLSHDVAAYARYTQPIDERSMLVGYARASRRWTTPDEFSNTRFAVTAACQHLCTDSIIATAGVTLAYSIYDDYFESITDEERRDFLVNPFISLNWQLNAHAMFGVSLSYARNYSGVDSVDYESAGIAPYVELNWRF